MAASSSTTYVVSQKTGPLKRVGITYQKGPLRMIFHRVHWQNALVQKALYGLSATCAVSVVTTGSYS